MKKVNEFKRGETPEKSLNIGYGTKPETKAWKVLEFIKSFGEEGVSLTDIQRFIYFDINKAPLGPDWFDEKNDEYYYAGKKYTPGRKSRGYWATQLYGKQSLLHRYCRKNDDGKWVFDHFPEPGKNIYEALDESIICKPLK